MAATPKRDNASDSPLPDEVQSPPEPAVRNEPTAEELERLRARLIEKYHN